MEGCGAIGFIGLSSTLLIWWIVITFRKRPNLQNTTEIVRVPTATCISKVG